MAGATTVEIRRNDERSRYELLEDGQLLAVAEFQDRGDVVVLPHTVVTPPRRGEGLGERLVEHALTDLRARGRKVLPVCWFVAEYLERHPEHADLRA